MSSDRYPTEILDDYADDGTMPERVATLADAVVGHRIVSIAKEEVPEDDSSWRYREQATIITLDNGRKVILRDNGDCCAYTAMEAFLLHPDKIEHIIAGVGTTDGYSTWHIFADFGDVAELTVGWSAGNTGYYIYGFDIAVIDPEGVTA